MKLGIASDLHFEFHRNTPDWMPPLPLECDVMVLAGDIDVGGSTIDTVLRIAEAMPNTTIVWIAGNHEYYKACIDKQTTEFREAFKDNDQVYYLENDSVNIDGYTFLGTTLWTGFDCLGIAERLIASIQAQESIYDFKVIRQAGGEKPFKAVDARYRFVDNYQWLDKALAKTDSDKTVVISHFPPRRDLRHKGIEEDLLTAYFQADCDALIREHKPALWLYGHNHWSDDRLIDGTRFVSNQYGYPNEKGLPAFNRDNIIEMGKNLTAKINS